MNLISKVRGFFQNLGAKAKGAFMALTRKGKIKELVNEYMPRSYLKSGAGDMAAGLEQVISGYRKLPEGMVSVYDDPKQKIPTMEREKKNPGHKLMPVNVIT